MMDVDNDIDSQLLQQFSSMATQDKEVLIAEFQRLLGDQLNSAGCAFFLDMNNWNLQAAICSYYDFEQPSVNVKVPCMSFVSDVTIGEGESVPTSTNFIKTWRLRNSGEEQWPPGCCLKFVDGHQFAHRDRVMVDALSPGCNIDVSVDMTSPGTTGMYQGQWRMTTATGLFFGDVIWVILHVEESGLLGVTQQLSQFGSELSRQQPQVTVDNPFASPLKFGCDPSQSPANKVFGSPAMSTIAQHGSLPSSPCMQQAPETGAPSATSHVRSLFPTPDHSPGNGQSTTEAANSYSSSRGAQSSDADNIDMS